MRRTSYPLSLRLVVVATLHRVDHRRFSSTSPVLDDDHQASILDNDVDVESMTEALLQNSTSGGTGRRSSAVLVPPLLLRHMTPSEAKRSSASAAEDDDEDGSPEDGAGIDLGGHAGEGSADSASVVSSNLEPGMPAASHHRSVASPLEAYLQAHPVEGPSHPFLHDTPLVELLEKVAAYCRSTDNPRLVNADDEAALFPALVRRLQECHAVQLLDVAEMSMARSTLVRHGLLLRDLVRDRIGLLAGQLTPAEVLRSIVVMGIVVAGRRKRDLEFFQVLGRLFMLHINHYKDPGDLVRVMTAFSRAKIVPPPAFLDLIGRRLPVLSKSHPLAPLPAYRLLTNLYKMGHDQLPSFRFLADRICQHAETQLRNERAVQRTAALWSQQPSQANECPSASASDACGGGGRGGSAAPAAAVPVPPPSPSAPDDTQGEAQTVPDANLAARPSSAAAPPLSSVTATTVTLSPVIVTRRRFVSVSGLRPSQFTKLLLVLARCGAPHQQYLRPFVASLLAPNIAHLSPPVFSRLIRATRMFRSPDAPLISALMAHLVRLGPRNALITDLLELIRILASPDVPAIPNTEAFIACCVEAFRTSHALRPTDMCAVSFELMRIQEKVDVPLESVESLVGVLDDFAQRMLRLLDLRVLSLQHAELLTDACRRMHHPDASGTVEKLRLARLAVNEAEGSDEAYYAAVDIDVRETFHMILVVNHCNTFGAFRPIPGPLQADLRHGLTKVSASCILQAAHLFEAAFPGTLMPPLERLLARSLLAKLRAEGEEVVVGDTTGAGVTDGPSSVTGKLSVVLRPNEPLRFTRESLKEFVRLLLVTPLTGVRSHASLWRLLEAKGHKLGVLDVAELCRQQRNQQSQQQPQ